MSVLADERGGVALLPLVHDYVWGAPGEQRDLTRGMGAFAPVRIDEPVIDEVLDGIRRVLGELRESGLTYTGSLTTNVILGPEGPELLEFNSHVGDPETQTVLPLIDGSVLELLVAAGTGGLGGLLDLHRPASGSSVSLSLVRPGYPDAPVGDVVVPTTITGDPSVHFYDTYPVEGGLAPWGGRVLSCHAHASTFEDAVAGARRVAQRVLEQVPDLRFREDIGAEHDSTTPLTAVLPIHRRQG
jgi:phosphoribosylamine--glycine ligase